MFKKYLLAVIVVFIAFCIIDWFVNSLILMDYYTQTASLWRPLAQMKWAVMYIMSFLVTASFVYIYWKMIGNKSVFTGLKYGAVWGFASGLGMGYGMYAMMPIPYFLAFGWFISGWIEYTIAGYLTGLIVRE